MGGATVYLALLTKLRKPPLVARLVTEMHGRNGKLRHAVGPAAGVAHRPAHRCCRRVRVAIDNTGRTGSSRPPWLVTPDVSQRTSVSGEVRVLVRNFVRFLEGRLLR